MFAFNIFLSIFGFIIHFIIYEFMLPMDLIFGGRSKRKQQIFSFRREFRLRNPISFYRLEIYISLNS